MSSLTEAELDRAITYASSAGQVFSTEIREILVHVALHGQYHRGQINARLRAGGTDPVNVDFIMYSRLKQSGQ